MARVTLNLGAPTHTSDGNWVQWDERDTGLGDISVFTGTAGEERHLIRLRVFRNGSVQFQVIETPDGSSGFSSREDMSSEWTGFNEAITLQVSGLDDLVLSGPTSSDSDTTDSSEAYRWEPGGAIEAWFDAYDDDFTRSATVILDDGVNSAPTADAGDGQSVAAGASVTLDGSGSTDADDNIDAYLWEQTSGTTVTLSDDSAESPTFAAPSTSSAHVLEFRLTVTDEYGESDTDTVTVNVAAMAATNDPPVAAAGADQTVDGGDTVTLDGTGSTDPDDNIDTYAWAQVSGPTVTLQDTSVDGVSTFTAPDATQSDQALVFRLTVTDDDGASDTDDISITVSAAASSDERIGTFLRDSHVEARWLFEANFDSYNQTDEDRFWSDFPLTLEGQDYEPLIVERGVRIAGARINPRGGMSPVISATLEIADDGTQSAIADTHTLVNDPVRGYLLFVDGNETNDDRIPLIEGVLEHHQVEENIWRLEIRDDTKRLIKPFPAQVINPVQYPLAYEFGQPVPVAFGLLNALPTGPVSAVLAPCAIIDRFATQVTPGTRTLQIDSLWQWYPQSNLFAQIVSIGADTPGEADFQEPGRLLTLRAFRPKTNNDIDDWRIVRSGDTDEVEISSGETLAVFMAGSAALGDITALTLEIEATGDYNLSVYDDTTQQGNTVTASDNHTLSLDRDTFAGWNLALLNVEITPDTASAVQIEDIRLEIEFDDFSSYQDSPPSIWAECQGYADDVDNYVDGAVIAQADQVLRNPVHQLQALCRDSTILGLPDARIVRGWDDAATSREDWHFDWALSTTENYPMLDRFLFEAGLALFPDGGGFSIAALDQFRDPQHFFSGLWDCPVLNYQSSNPEDWDWDLRVQRATAEDIINEVHLRFRKHGPTGEYRDAVTLSGEHRIDSTCSVDTSGQLTDTSVNFNDLNVLVGETVFIEGDIEYSVVSIVSDHVLEVETEAGIAPGVKPAGTRYWLGPNLDAAMLVSQQTYKTVNPLGQAQEDFADQGGYTSDFIAAEATARLLAEHVRDWFALPRDRLFFPLTHVASELRAGDVFMLDHPQLRDGLRPHDLTQLSAALGDAETATTINVDQAASLQADDWLVMQTDQGQPEVVFVESLDLTANTAEVLRGQLGTARLSWPVDTQVSRLEVKFLALHVRPPLPDDPIVRVEAIQMPPFYTRVGLWASDTAPDYEDATAQQRLEGGYWTLENGQVVDRMPATAISHWG